MAAQSSLAIYGITEIGVKNVSLQREANILTNRYSERASRTTNRITGLSGSTIYLNEADPVLNIDIGGYVIQRAGLANAAPGQLISGSMIANWRNGATAAGQEDHFGWDVFIGWNFIVRDPTITRVRAGLSEISLSLALECTATVESGQASGGDNTSDPVPDVSTVMRIVTIYTDKGTFQKLSFYSEPSPANFFGSDTGKWDEGAGVRPISNILPSHYGDTVPDSPYNVLGINVQAASGFGSVAGGEWIAGDATEVVSGGQTIYDSGTDIWVFIYASTEGYDRYHSDLVTGDLPDEDAAIATFSPAKTRDDFYAIYSRTLGFTKEGEDVYSDPLSWFT